MDALPRARFETWGTTAEIIVTAPRVLDGAVDLAVRDCAAVDRACSRFRLDSEIWQAAAAFDGRHACSPLLARHVRAALDAAKLTGGAIDPTVGHDLIRLGYDRDFSFVAGEEGTSVPARRSGISWRDVSLDDAAGMLAMPAGTVLDLGATAKALAADDIARSIASAWVCGALVNLGGDLACAGVPPPGGWRITLSEDRISPLTPAAEVAVLFDGGLATSSTTIRRWMLASDAVHHIVDPATGRSASGPWRTAIVAADSCLSANTAATAALVWGEAALAKLETFGLPAVLIGNDGLDARTLAWPSSRGTS